MVASHIKRTGLVDIIGSAGQTNAFDEDVQKLDQFANELLVNSCLTSGQVSAVLSEELAEPVTPTENKGQYVVMFDPLDGSSNVDTGISIGTIFSIYDGAGGMLQPGSKQIAAGYILYGTSVMFVYTMGRGVNGFTLDPSIGSFLLSNPRITIPEKGSIYSINEGYTQLYDERLTRYLSAIKEGEKPYKLRYAGSMVADIHRTLLKGGIFLYPGDRKNPNGKLRLLYEVNPMAFLITQAGGKAVSNGTNPQEIVPHEYAQRVPIALGSRQEIDRFVSITTG